MAKAKGTAVKKATTKVAKSFKVSYQPPGSLPKSVTVKDGTLGDFITEYSLTNYEVSLNGSTTKSHSTLLAKGDTIRAGIRTKNNL